MPKSSDLDGYHPIGLAKLLALELPDLKYFVEGILPEGLTLVAGAPKIGKSWLTLQGCIGVAAGGELLGRRCAQRPVFYYALEDGYRRIQKRAARVADLTGLDLASLPLEIQLASPRLGEGLEEEIDTWFTKHRGGLVWIDVFTKVRPDDPRRGGSAYDVDYSALTPLHDLTREHSGSALVVNSHDRKATSEDFLNSVTGTKGMTATPDSIWVVKRPRLDPLGSIYVTGRDIEKDMLLSAYFDGAWTLDGRPIPTAGSERNRVYEWLDKNGPAFAKGVADGLGISRESAQQFLTKMHKANQLQKTAAGYDVDRMTAQPEGKGVQLQAVIP